jgi:DedD protein
VERHVKERLVGAAVLMAAAIILIPEMLSGPDRQERPAVTAPARDTALKTYTIDLQQHEEGAPSAVIEERAPPAETPPDDAAEPEAAPQPNPQADVQEPPTQAAPVAEQKPAAAPPVAVTRTEPVGASAPARPEPPQPAAAQPNAIHGGTWAVQIGSYSRQSSAERLAGELRTAGHTAFVMPIQTSSATLYRVRVGPMSDRAAAAALLSDLKARFPGAAIVAHP